ncbi:glycosyltransferase family 39 protein [Muricauda sp. 334s03]|uniref:Glycosyltransferase family 39 protein n=1 Tax=Flagellimonas yonaguniensis TaxID=3031325 RepID=A0ABT5Y2B4_9FLAO|nr:glycosyltransferase family 39 protein [[Muricauda] yonaguniensis]MDF0717590.1 glycosyltransferase family 39 protein [[Muricauda] yonaguniensis]
MGLIICISFVGIYPIYILDEARNSEAAREMLASGNYIVPFFNGQLRTDKPPLHYFFMILGYKLFGVNAFGARFFSGVFGALTVLITYWNIKKWQNQTLAIIVSTVLLSSLFFVQEFHLAVPDPYLIFFITLSLFSFYGFYKTEKQSWLFPFYGAMALGVLTKGPIAIVLPGLIVPSFLLFKKDFNLKTILGLRPFFGLLLILLIAGPWYYLVHIHTEGIWTEGFFLDHNMSRFGSEKEGHGGLFVLTSLYVVLGLLPFSVFIIQGFYNAWKVRRKNDFVLFSLIVSTITMLFFSVSSTKLPNYPMPSYPFVAILIGFYLYKAFLIGKKTRFITASLIFLIVVGVILPIGGWIGLTVEKQLQLFRPVSLFLLLATLSAIVGFYFYQKGRFKHTFLSISCGWILMAFSLFGVIYPTLTQLSPVSLALLKIPADSKIIAFKRFDSAFPINFRRTFPVYDTVQQIEVYLQKYPRAYIITNTRNEKDLEALEGFHLVLEQKAVFENHVTRVYTK